MFWAWRRSNPRKGVRRTQHFRASLATGDRFMSVIGYIGKGGRRPVGENRRPVREKPLRRKNTTVDLMPFSHSNDRRLRLRLAGCLCLIGFSIGVSASKADENSRVDFKHDLIPVFTKLGCNAGACHGAALGRGGFKLSLYGGNPAKDFEAVTRHLQGRRINLARPEDSLLILKPSEQLEHAGGQLIDADDEHAQKILAWIRQGTRSDSRLRLERVDITPADSVTKAVGRPIRLNAIAHYTDGQTRDVTRWTVFTAEDESSVKIDTKTAVARVLRRGRHIVVARYLDRVVPIELIVPINDDEIAPAETSSGSFIDREIAAKLQKLALPTSDTIDDSAFIRRVTLDLTGRLPTPKRVNEFLTKNTKDEDRRELLVDELLDSSEFDEYWTLQLAKLFRVRPLVDDVVGMGVYHDWFAQQISQGVGFDRMVRRLLLSTGDSHHDGPANFHRTTKNAQEQTEFV